MVFKKKKKIQMYSVLVYCKHDWVPKHVWVSFSEATLCYRFVQGWRTVCVLPAMFSRGRMR